MSDIPVTLGQEHKRVTKNQKICQRVGKFLYICSFIMRYYALTKNGKI